MGKLFAAALGVAMLAPGVMASEVEGKYECVSTMSSRVVSPAKVTLSDKGYMTIDTDSVALEGFADLYTIKKTGVTRYLLGNMNSGATLTFTPGLAEIVTLAFNGLYECTKTEQ